MLRKDDTKDMMQQDVINQALLLEFHHSMMVSFNFLENSLESLLGYFLLLQLTTTYCTFSVKHIPTQHKQNFWRQSHANILPFGFTHEQRPNTSLHSLFHWAFKTFWLKMCSSSNPKGFLQWFIKNVHMYRLMKANFFVYLFCFQVRSISEKEYDVLDD